MTLDARKRFRLSPHGKIWSEAVATDWFQEGLAAALVTMGQEAGISQDMGTAAAIACRAEGARKFITIMLTLTDTEPERKAPATPHNLANIK